MTEQEWLECEDPQRMLAKVIRRGVRRRDSEPGGSQDWASDRKLRLFACACYWLACNCASDSAVAGNPRETIQIVEDWADHGKEPPLQGMPFRRRTDPDGDWELIPAPELAEGANSWARSWRFDEACKADILRDIIGNPYRPAVVTMTKDEDFARSHGHIAYEWLTPTVLTLAEAAYEEREKTGHLDPVRLAVLADALEEAGCVNEDILTHLRSPGPHWRGCWAVDLLTGKE